MDYKRIVTAFLAGAITVIIGDFVYRRYTTTHSYKLSAQTGRPAVFGRKKLLLEDRSGGGRSTLAVPEGIQACIGNTPLFRIKSLSDATNCDILAKAEVRFLIFAARLVVGVFIGLSS